MYATSRWRDGCPRLIRLVPSGRLAGRGHRPWLADRSVATTRLAARSDLIVTDDWMIVENQAAFERLFREFGHVERHVSEWVKGITDHLPMSERIIAPLRDVALRDSRTWRKLREIRRRDQHRNLTVDAQLRIAVRQSPKTSFLRATNSSTDSAGSPVMFSTVVVSRS